MLPCTRPRGEERGSGEEKVEARVRGEASDNGNSVDAHGEEGRVTSAGENEGVGKMDVDAENAVVRGLPRPLTTSRKEGRVGGEGEGEGEKSRVMGPK